MPGERGRGRVGVGEVVERGRGDARLARALDDLGGERPDADDDVDPAGEGAAALAVQRGAGRPELEHVARAPRRAGGRGASASATTAASRASGVEL